MNIKLLKDSVLTVRDSFPDLKADCALILGSGWGDVADGFEIEGAIDYADIPCMGKTGVAGHQGRLVKASTNGLSLLLFQGRRHWYEGCGWDPIAFPPYLCSECGVSVVMITNAAGGISNDLQSGDLMVIDDHINAMGSNPLIGEHLSCWGARFPDQTCVYDSCLRDALDAAGRAVGESLKHGVYAATSGPTYETPAEIGALRKAGASAVGMSTVPEAILSNAAGMEVAGLSCITNTAAGVGNAPLSHDEVIAAGNSARPRMVSIVKEFLKGLSQRAKDS